ncbi:hypothetical protein [Bradyrhizobium quebecense]|uniref:Uncharacterized protein n=2 Tax=Bradyrhizobium quebecense TaxID=2748629 RepID=A0ACD3VFP0_9BRAD|nr:hypothetical protein [Bradyrhizobium quebecense]UGY05243.1 hypothetical protein J4P68_0011105 [Bradyrhizobium quebecense]
MTRWEALVRFDDEIRSAVRQLIPFGSPWVEELREAFFALNEDRSYLPNIVNRLIEEATIETLEAERTAAIQWTAAISKMPNGEVTSKEGMAVFIELRARGYQFAREGSDIAISRSGRGTSFVRSNAEIMRLGRILLREPRQE